MDQKINKKTKINNGDKNQEVKVGKVGFKQTGPKRRAQKDGLKQMGVNIRVQKDGFKNWVKLTDQKRRVQIGGSNSKLKCHQN